MYRGTIVRYFMIVIFIVFSFLVIGTPLFVVKQGEFLLKIILSYDSNNINL